MAATSENNLVDIGRDLTREQRSLTVTDLDKEVLESGHFKSDQIKESQLYREVQNVQQVIRLTEDELKNLKELHKRTGFSHPPSIYFEEVEDLTVKLDALRNKEKTLLHKKPVQNGNIHNDSSDDSAPSSPSPLRSGATSTSSYGDVIPSSPLRAHFRAYLPNNQRTMIKYKHGQTVRDALYKAMTLRALTADSYVVYLKSTRERVDWDADVASLDGAEVSVELFDDNYNSQTQSLSHNFVRKTFFTLAFCDACRKLLFQGFRCTTCGYRFHQKCGAPSLCQQAEHLNIYKRMLASNPPAATLPNMPTTPRPLGPRERSISAPNVNMIGQPGGPESIIVEVVLEKNYQHSRTRHEPATISGGLIRQLSGQSSQRGHLSDIFTPDRDQGNVFNFSAANSVPLSNVPTSQPHQPISGIPGSLLHPAKTRNSRRDSNDDWEINDGEVQVGQRIGSGSYGTVYKGFWHGTVAVKMLNVKDPNPQQLQAFKNEVAVLRKTRHVNILLFMGCMSKPNLSIVTQWCEGSSLYRHLHVMENKFTMVQLLEIARQSAQGVDYLHAKSIIHRDLKSNNIFLQEDLTVKVGDFGLATVKTRWSGDHGCEQPSGSILWMAPEVIKMQDPNPYTFMSDVYAFGICIYELITSTLPYSNIGNKDQLIYMVGRGYLRPDQSKIRSDCPKALRRLYIDCIKYNREERPLFIQILASIESILRALPKITRSTSEPLLHRAKPSTDVDISYPCPTPHTPIRGSGVFNFYSAQQQPVY
ncbi:serine/threonine-protein kinase A-Raf-like isoform X2 [Hydractinia symbiolongicarpus]|uniref:serine/threonine-protein kinase A-Raf-like isoform X2 n=1 Tax=Hydractinia symbiolongicarpus TaxID=13093 RepID=UPI00254D1807|nr:serine/threonine-protein kinase A-Raf-like isoform X2 [Hydractinia symbiolongicarpus]